MNWYHLPLRRILAPVSINSFQNETFDQNILHVSNEKQTIDTGVSKDFTTLFNWNSLNQILNRSNARGLSIRIVHNQLNHLFQKQGNNIKSILEKLKGGGTLVLEGIDQHDCNLAKFCDALTAEIGAKARINLYLSQPGQEGYPLHYDGHHFIILQIYGYKRWQIYKPTQPDPMKPAKSFSSPYHEGHQSEAPIPRKEQLLQEVVMAPGDILYVPRGYWHRAIAEQSSSLHLTVGLYQPNGIEFMSWLQEQLMEDPRFRKVFPLSLNGEYPQQNTAPSPFAQQFEALKGILLEKLNTPDILWRYHQDHWANLEHRETFSLPYQTHLSREEIGQSQYFKVRQAPIYMSENATGQLELVYQHQKLCLVAAAKPILDFLFSREHFSRSEIESQFPKYPWSVLLDMLTPLIHDGILIPASD